MQVTFSDVVSAAVQNYTNSLSPKHELYSQHTRFFKCDKFELSYQYVDSFGMVIEYTSDENFTYIIQKYEGQEKIVFDVYDDNRGGYNCVKSLVSDIPETEEEFFQRSTVEELWFTSEEIQHIEVIAETMKNEFTIKTAKPL